jgi:DNA uptake protein ComE-like DNA-binding protein
MAVGLSASTWSPAQEEGTKPTKPKLSKEALEAKAKAREKRVQAKAKASAEAKAKAVDINHATKEELKALPGITDAYAEAIVAKRPYKSKADLVTKNVIPLGVFQGVRKQVAAK